MLRSKGHAYCAGPPWRAVQHGHASPGSLSAAWTRGVFDFERRVNNAARRAARLGGPVALVGHSMGGLLVGRVANAVPELLAHICYMAAVCPSHSMPSLDACATSPEGQRAIGPADPHAGHAGPRTPLA
ncbi:alpha/beta fold hydrolase [Streptomyces sp. 2A115]|uniref:alpha/beta fold hydrolase n=1 Tax=Streptomyces sp. 2A115 TaxID=3457439 RepID=UPI003FCFFBF4